MDEVKTELGSDFELGTATLVKAAIFDLSAAPTWLVDTTPKGSVAAKSLTISA